MPGTSRRRLFQGCTADVAAQAPPLTAACAEIGRRSVTAGAMSARFREVILISRRDRTSALAGRGQRPQRTRIGRHASWADLRFDGHVKIHTGIARADEEMTAL